jgi:hypothetical protein
VINNNLNMWEVNMWTGSLDFMLSDTIAREVCDDHVYL